MLNKIGLIGGGYIGGVLAQEIARRRLAREVGLSVGVPAILGKNGVEQVIELDLTDEEKAALEISVAGVRKTCDEADEMLANL